MFSKIEEKLNKIGASQEFIDDDNLSKMVNTYAENELFEDELDFVAAAGSPDFNKFLQFKESKLNSKGE